MHYLVIENKQQEELTYDIAGFFWDNGNEVSIQSSYTPTDHNYRSADCIISLDNNSFSEQDILTTKPLIHFCHDGVYSNLIPHPHKIFEFKGLNERTLTAFFSWCTRLNLFKK
ncbi:hypothetical protein [Sphingobacterium puteale]|uniref:hypothetical protein n=1 Tax=Sphingobacterium puteale TaxID=2420510 RepID=UPI003D969B45